MAVRTAYIDVDLTLIDIEDQLLDGVEEGLKWMSKRYTLICWSAGGEEYARKICEMHGLTKYFKHILDKPDLIVDDSPDSILKHTNIIRIRAKNSWLHIRDKVFHKCTEHEDEEKGIVWG